MDGLFTVFGLGTAFGVFMSWMYDVIRKRNQPVSRGASFEAFHGNDVMPAPEPSVSAAGRPSEPMLHPELDIAPMAKPVEQPIAAPFGLSEAKAPARIDPLPALSSLAPLPKPAPVIQPRPVAAPVSVAPAAPVAPVVSAPVVPVKPAAPVVNAPVVTVAPMKETVVLEKPPVAKVDVDAAAKPAVEDKAAPVVAKPSETKAPVAAEDVVFTQADVGSADGLDLNFDASDVSFADTVSFEPTDFELPPVAPRAPRVVLLVNNTVVRDVQENDLLGLMLEFGILADSEEAGLFQRGDAVTVGRTTVQLVQA